MNNVSHDNAMFDRLVDGELSAAERQQLLASLDEQENGWRRCALAFLESQAWGGELKRMAAEPVEAAADPSAARATRPSSRSTPSRSTPTKFGQGLAVAACVLVAFSLGWVAKSDSPAGLEATEIAGNNDPTVERLEMPLREDLPLENDDAITLLVRDTSGNDRRLQVPLMEVEALDDQFADALPAELRDRFRNRGFDVQRRRRFAPMFFEQDKELVPMVVPVDDTYLVPVDRPVY